jgi:DNA-binding transcriptional ArsR family regulator
MSSEAPEPEPAEDLAPQPRDLGGDPVALRALAHPLRLRLLEELTMRGPLTATEAAERVGESPSSCSFHLRTLAKYGFIEEAGGGTGRQRPWRVVTTGNRWATTRETPAAEWAAGEALSAVVRERDQRLLDEHLAHRDQLDDEWLRSAFNSNFGGWLTPAELDELGERLTELWQPYLARLTRQTDIPPDARLVHMFAYAFPRADYYDETPPTANGERSDDDNDDGRDGDSDA